MITFGFYDSLNGDRALDSRTFSTPFSHIIEEGVFSNYGKQYRVTSNGTMGVTVGPGASWCNMTWTRSDDDVMLALSAADATYTRIDRIVLRHDNRPAVRSNGFVVIKGAPGSVPVAPALENSDVVKDLLIAEIKVTSGMTEVGQSSIINKVGTATTPYVTAPLAKVDASPIIETLSEQFQSWFETVQNTLDGDVAANLAQGVADLKKRDSELQLAIDKLVKAPAPVAIEDTGWVEVTSMRSGWKSNSVQARVRNGELFVSGLIQRTTGLRESISNSIAVFDHPPKIASALAKAGWSTQAKYCGSGNSPGGFYTQLYAEANTVGIRYRNRNPYTTETIMINITGAIV